MTQTDDPFADQAAPAPDPFAGPTSEDGDPFAGPRQGGGSVAPSPGDLGFRLLAVKYVKESKQPTKFVKENGETTGLVFHVNLAVLDGGPILATKANEDYSTTTTEMGDPPAVYLDYWVWQVGIQNSVNKTGLTLGRLVRSPATATKKTIPDRAALEAVFARNPALISDPKGPKWFWMLADPTAEDRALAMTWYRANPSALNG